MLLEEGLTAHGLQVKCAATPEEALALASTRRYDVVICDLHLSVRGAPVNGMDAAEKLLAAAAAPKPELILMTGDYSEDSELDPANGPRRLQKPFRISEVIAMLKELLPANPPAVSPR